MEQPIYELATLDRMLAHFSEKQKQYAEYHRVCEKVYYYGPGASKVAFFIAGLILAVTHTLALIACFLGEWPAVLGFWAFGMVPSVFLVGGGLLVHWRNRVNYRQSCDAYLALADELMAHYEAFGPCPLGPEYTDPQTLAAIRSCLENGRAATIGECTGLILSKASKNALDAHLSRLARYTGHLRQLPVFYPGRFFSADPREFRDFLKHNL